MGHKHSVRDTGAHFIIDQYTKVIKNDSANKTKLAQYDHNSQRFTFEIPAVDGHVMALCDLIEIHFINISVDGNSQNEGVYEVNDIKADGENSVFTWLISQEATQLAGSLNFFIVFKCTENGETVYRWGTEIYKNLPVSEGMNNGEAVLTEYPDILAQWKARIFGASDNAVLAVETAKTNALAAIEAAGEAKKQSVLDSIPDEYEALSALADHNHRNKAGAIVLNAEGESIVVKDASEYPLQNLKVFGKSEQLKTTGKNLFNPENVVKGYPYNITGLFVENSANRTGYVTCEPNTTYVVSKKVGSRFALAYTTKIPAEGVTVYNMVTGYDSESLTITTGPDAVYLIVWAYNGNVDTTITDTEMLATVQVEKGNTATEFEPYTGGVASPSPEYPQEINNVENAGVRVCGKNWLVNEFEPGYSETVMGVTFTIGADKSIHVSGTPTAAIAYNIMQEVFPAGTYYLSGSPSVASTKFRLQANKTTDGTEKTGGVDVGTGAKITIDSNGTLVRAYIYVASDAGEVDGIFYPQIEQGTKQTEYEPYSGGRVVVNHTLPGIPVTSGGNYTDANGQQWICDEVDLARGVYIQRIARKEFDGVDGETITLYADRENVYGFALKIIDTDMLTISHDARCTRFENIITGISSVDKECFLCGAGTKTIYVMVKKERLSEYSVAAFKEWLSANPIVILFQLATPIETPLSDAEITAFKALCTNKPNTTILNDAGAHMVAQYVADTKTYIDNKIAEMMGGVTE